MAERRHTFGKSERLCGRSAIGDLIQKGRSGEIPGTLRFRYLTGTGTGLNRIMVSVPKRNFKRAVRRNLLKRRMRESYRLQKQLLTTTGNDILFTYSAREVLPYGTISDAVGRVLVKINGRTAPKHDGNEQ